MRPTHNVAAALCLFVVTLHAASKPPGGSDGKSGFTRLPAEETGITFQNSLRDESGAKNRNLYNGSGVALGDFDGDGACDIYFCSLEGENKLYRNLGIWKFADVTKDSGVALPGVTSRGAVFADIDGDRDLDLLVTAMGKGVIVLQNDGQGRFADITEKAGTATSYGAVSMALADVDGNGTLDLYVATHRVKDFRDEGQVDLLRDNATGKLIIPPNLKDRFTISADGNLQEFGEPDQLYLNDGTGKFTLVSWTEGAFRDADGKLLDGPPLDWGLAAIFHDANGDGAPDLYVCNDYWTPDRFYFNDGKGNFREVPKLAMRSQSASSMGVDFADFNRDGHMDFFVVDMLSREHQRRKQQMGAMKPTPVTIGEVENRPQIMRNTMFLNRGDNTWAEMAYLAGVHASEWSWQPIFLDVDLDGYQDLLVSSGHARDVQDADMTNEIADMKQKDVLLSKTLGLRDTGALSRQEKFTAELLAMAKLRPRLETPIVAFRNKGDLTFEERDWGTGHLAVHHGLATADLDGDGDLDLVCNTLDTPAGIYRNNAAAPRVAVRLKGAGANTQGIGARVTLRGGPIEQTQEMISGGRYESGGDAVLSFAAGEAKALEVEVRWRNGKVSRLSAVKPNATTIIDEATAEEVQKDQRVQSVPPLFTDISETLNHTHHENEFDDFKRQSLLPNRLSQLGPGVGFIDLTGDEKDDLFVGAGASGKPFLGNPSAKFFHPMGPLPVDDQSGVAAFAKTAGSVRLLSGVSNFHHANIFGPSDFSFGFNDKGKAELFPPKLGSERWGHQIGPVCIADVNGDRALDLFYGGRSVPGKYPEPATSRLFLGSEHWALSLTSVIDFKSLGLVSGATFTDLNADGAPDLVLAIEWGPVRIFLNDGKGNFRDATKELGIENELGWWNGVASGDLDGDGRMDLIATNWGRNSKFEHHYDSTHPLLIYWGDFNQDGVTQIVEAHFDHAMNKLVPERGLSCSSRAMPFIREVAPTYTKFGGAGLTDLYQDKLTNAPVLKAHVLDTSIFFNRGDKFERRSLPIEAQMAPAFGCIIQDFDGNGTEDVFLGDNFFAPQIETPRMDGGRSLLLTNDGRGKLTPMPGQLSGIKAYGDARGCATGDLDADGRADLLISQNGWRTHLYKNERAKPGLRVRFAGPEHNATAIGAQARLIFGEEKGPAKEVQSGTGYWSQNSHTLIFGLGDRVPTAIWVRWPGGKETTTPIAAGAKEITARP